MAGPPGMRPSTTTSPALPMRRRWDPRRPAHRAVMVQCNRCDALATGTAVAGRLTSALLPTEHDGQVIKHLNCGGVLVAYDTTAVGA